MKLKYYRGSRDHSETIEYEVEKRGRYITTCVINVKLLTAGLRAFPCGSGDDIKLTPEQRLEVLTFLKAERKKITDSYPIKTCEGWDESGLPTFEDYCFPGDKVEEAIVNYFADSVPPVTFQPGFVQAGEAYNREPDENGRWRNTYTTFTIINGERDRAGRSLWRYRGLCFRGQTENRVNGKSRLEELISAAQREAET